MNQASPTPAPITAATTLAGLPARDTLTSPFCSAGNTITVNGKTISFNSGAGTTGSAAAGTSRSTLPFPAAPSVALLTTIDQITGTANPSTIDATTGAITLAHRYDAQILRSRRRDAVGVNGFRGARLQHHRHADAHRRRHRRHRLCGRATTSRLSPANPSAAAR